MDTTVPTRSLDDLLPEVDETEEPAALRPSLGVRLLARFGLVGMLAVLFGVFAILRPATFPTTANLTGIAANYSLTLIVALSVVPVLVIGEFDLSVTATMAWSNYLVARLVLVEGQSVWVAVGVALLSGALIGLVNALLILRFKVNSFIATLAISTVLAGLVETYHNGAGVQEQQVQDHGQTVVYEFPGWFLDLSSKSLLGVPRLFWTALVLVAVLALVFDHTSTGRRCLAIGSNRDAALLSGVRVNLGIIGCFVACGVIASFAGVMLTAQLGSGNTTVSAAYLLPGYAGAFLGATVVRPGRFNAWGTLIGVYLVGVAVAGLQQIGVDAWVQDVFNGGALVLAVAGSGFLTRFQRRGDRRRRRFRPPIRQEPST